MNPNSHEMDQVGFVVIGRNEGERLAQSLGSVLALSHRVVYADSCSTDGSLERARSLGAIAVPVPTEDGPMTAARGRNTGYAVLRSHFPKCEFVQFIDGDCILQPHWIMHALRFMRANPKAGVACGRRFEAHPNVSIYNWLCNDEWDTPIGLSEYSGGDALIRTAAFDSVDGYRAFLSAGEEPDMTSRMRGLGWEIWRLDADMTEHDARMTRFGQWWRRTHRGGFAYAQVWSLTGHLPKRAFRAQLRSALFWAVALPLGVVAAAFAFGRPAIFLFLPAAYGAQIVRLAIKRGLADGRSWQRAAMMMLSKVPETLGAIQFLLGGKMDPSSYKVGLAGSPGAAK